MSKLTASQLKKELSQFANPEKAKFFPTFFKAGKGEYAEGDRFIGVTVPNQRTIAKKYIDLSLDEVQVLLNSNIHEHRLSGLLVLVYQYQRASKPKTRDEQLQKRIVRFYLKNTRRANNWDLVDSSASYILGEWLSDKKDRKILNTFARSNNLWQRRIAIIATHAFIKKGDLDDTYTLSRKLLSDEHDLIHKAVGWMLREAGKKDVKKLETFLELHAAHMPRTMLRYSIEKFSDKKRKYYLSKK